ncbi:pyocin activator PrtN family protein [Morganella morganii]|uniref:pyocin activator PrtN family protein n=1 Tax=Morganella morganii TaxID=582 RepID=UPI0004657CE3|nr:pyocin activator PrtN family protein [Morganella morganii]HBN5914559.1 pyocin activator PrtN family protein [Morganella morganii]HBY5838721.1 pyocin activator protein PrtN [Klebsiella pneumoniae]HCK3361661.1 pyocin activator PrtN family protein [Morganella morganii]
MNTKFLLMAEYETSQIPLAVVAKKFLNITEAHAVKKANLGELPFPVYRDTTSQKSIRMVHINDLAEWIDTKRKIARSEFFNLK